MYCEISSYVICVVSRWSRLIPSFQHVSLQFLRNSVTDRQMHIHTDRQTKYNNPCVPSSQGKRVLINILAFSLANTFDWSMYREISCYIFCIVSCWSCWFNVSLRFLRNSITDRQTHIHVDRPSTTTLAAHVPRVNEIRTKVLNPWWRVGYVCFSLKETLTGFF